MSFTEAQIEAARRAIAALVWDDSEAHARYYYEVCRTAEHHERMAATCNHCEFVRLTEIARAALEAAERAAFRPIEEAPKDGTPILTYWPTLYGAEQYSVRSWQTGDWGRIRAGWADCWMQIKPNDEPTHFRPLPAPPEGTPA